jgi:methionyl aminopeptidase
MLREPRAWRSSRPSRGVDDYAVDANSWTIRSTDGSRAAHVEHTIAITADGPRVLTALA